MWRTRGDVMDERAETFDFVIVGSGGGSMCAALVARSLGKTAVILEKTDLVGGTTSRSGGAMWVPNNCFMQRDGIEDSYERAMTYLDHVVGDNTDTRGATRERRGTYVREAPQMLEFLLQQGISFHRYPYWPDYNDDLPGGLKHGRVVVADLFNVNELRTEKSRLRPNYVPLPASLEDVMQVPLAKRTLRGKWAMLKIGLRMATSRITGKQFIGGGAALQGRMFQKALQAGVDIRTGAPVDRILTDATGRVNGVRASIGGRQRQLVARHGVLINAGGFARNQAMRNKYQPGANARWSVVCEGDTGEMIEELMRLGAAVAQMDEMVGIQVTLPPDEREINPMVMPELFKPHSIVVDQSGQRYVREAQSYQSFCHDMFERNKAVPAIPSWLVMDSQYVAKYMVSENLPGAALPQAWLERGFVVRAATLAELARACAMGPDKLIASVTRFNEFARKGKDEDFHRGERAYDNFYADPTHKPSSTLGTLERGPFYAYRFYPGDIGTTGGAVTDVHARVLKEDGTAIPGLYATGNSTASVMGRAYPGGGSCVGPSFLWGYVAARHAMSATNAESIAGAHSKPRATKIAMQRARTLMLGNTNQ
jgi:3-oxosteroid 1-dehydrogenase